MAESLASVQARIAPNLEYQRHDLSSVWGSLSNDEFQNLSTHISVHGLIHPIILYEDRVIDGWHRYLACAVAHVTPHFRQLVNIYEGDPRDFVIAANGHRRNKSPRELAKAMLLTWEHALAGEGRRTLQDVEDVETHKKTKSEIAEMCGISLATVNRAWSDILNDRDPDRKESIATNNDAAAQPVQTDTVERNDSVQADVIAFEDADQDNINTYNESSAPMRNESALSPDSAQEVNLPAPIVSKTIIEGLEKELDILQTEYQDLQRKYEQVTSGGDQTGALLRQIDALETSNLDLTNKAAKLERSNTYMKRKLANAKKAAAADDIDALKALLVE